MNRLVCLLIAVSSLAACTQPFGHQLAAARTTADVSRLTKASPVCHELTPGSNECTWRRRASLGNGCVGYAQCASEAPRLETPSAWDVTVICKADERNRVTDCRSTGN